MRFPHHSAKQCRGKHVPLYCPIHHNFPPPFEIEMWKDLKDIWFSFLAELVATTCLRNKFKLFNEI